KYAIVDPDDYDRLSKYKWYATRSEHTFYARRTDLTGRKRRIIRMHREIIKVPDGMFVDHINHNGLDNRKANLRLATRAQNNYNRRRFRSPGSNSKFKGVSWSRYRNLWRARIGVNGKRKNIGYFQSQIEAAKAYDKAAKKYHKEFAVLNFPTKY
ncbi:MAG: HNH endonuclease, partial [Candidatus Thorarchaeota archaeon]